MGMRENVPDFFTEEAQNTFLNGENVFAYRFMGAHKTEQNGLSGWRFAVFAPHAQAVSVVGDFNRWNENAAPMEYSAKIPGIWYSFVPGLSRGALYKFAVKGSDGKTRFKADPFAFRSELRPGTASILWDIPSIKGTDKSTDKSTDKITDESTDKITDNRTGKGYPEKRSGQSPFNRPMNIYEAHLGSWKTGIPFDELTDELISYCADMGYTHIELLPVSEYPLDDSWGYQVTGYYSVTARYGEPEQLMRFIDAAHNKGLGVILDWVPAHFTKDEYGLRQFDGEPLFESSDPLRSEMPQWGTLLFDYSKAAVRNFLISNAVYWLYEFRADGLRVDAVSCMLYHDFSRSEWRPNIYGGNENLEAVDFIKQLNCAVHRLCPNSLMIAEESSAYPKVTEPVALGGLGFDFKWNMGFMNDTLNYFKKDSVYRKYHHNMLTFPMVYAFSEKHILPFSHDEVVHGKYSLIGRMPGNYEQKFEQLRLLYAYQYAHPGKKLNFMGSEFGQFIEWDFTRPLDWFLLDYPAHRAMLEFTRSLNRLYLKTPAFHREDTGWEGFRWLSADDNENSVIAFIRLNGRSRILVILNFLPENHEAYRINLNGIFGFPVKAECIFSTHARDIEPIKSKKLYRGDRYLEFPLFGYEGAYYKLTRR